MGEGSDHLQLIKFLAVLRPRERGLQRGENVWLRVLYGKRARRAVFASLRALFFIGDKRYYIIGWITITLSVKKLLHYWSSLH